MTPRTMTMPQIPTDILLEVVKHISANGDLCSVALSCSALRDQAQRILFHNPVPRTAYRHLIFIDTILSSPNRLGPMVKIFVHVSGSAYCDGEDTVLVFKTRGMLHAMCNLKRLAFRNAKSLPASVLDGATFQLDAFDWGSAHDNEHLVRKFLPTQPGLKHLTFHGDVALATMKGVELCPQLRSLAGGRVAVLLFATRKHVTHLQWMPQTRNEETFVNAGPGSNLFEGLHFLGCSMTHEGLPRFSNKLHSLVLLEITGHGIILDSDYYELQIRLEGIPLQVLVLVDYGYVVRTDAMNLGNVARNVFAWCSYLEYLDVSFPSTNLHRQFRRFHRADILEDINDAWTVVEEATVYEWRSLSNFGESSF